MKNLIAIAFSGVLLSLSCLPGSADSMMKGSMMMPTCASGDPVVGVNTMTKTYMSKDQMKTKMMGMSPDAKMAMMKKNHVKMMCKSKADAMGGTMMKAM